MSEKMLKRDSKSLLARLMAAENLNVEYSETATTAAFDTEGRTLIMPLLKDVSDEATDLFLGHEVGHALYTPQGRIKDIAAEGGMFKNFVNITEDARIEKLVQRKYPGLRGDFVKSYKKLFNDGLFGADIDTINKGGLIDRLNVYFKCGMTAGVKFTEDEKQWLPRIDKLETWEQVVTVTDELFAYCKKQKEEEQEQQEKNDAEEEEQEEQDESEEELSLIHI